MECEWGDGIKIGKWNGDGKVEWKREWEDGMGRGTGMGRLNERVNWNGKTEWELEDLSVI